MVATCFGIRVLRYPKPRTTRQCDGYLMYLPAVTFTQLVREAPLSEKFQAVNHSAVAFSCCAAARPPSCVWLLGPCSPDLFVCCQTKRPLFPFFSNPPPSDHCRSWKCRRKMARRERKGDASHQTPSPPSLSPAFHRSPVLGPRKDVGESLALGLAACVSGSNAHPLIPSSLGTAGIPQLPGSVHWPQKESLLNKGAAAATWRSRLH